MNQVPDYKELYLKMMRASEQAIRILVKAQQECEELYLSGPELTAFPGEAERPERRES